MLRSSRTEVFCEKAVLRNFAKLTGKHLCQSLFFNKVAGKYLTTDYLVQGARQRMPLEYYQTDSVFYQREYIYCIIFIKFAQKIHIRPMVWQTKLVRMDM